MGRRVRFENRLPDETVNYSTEHPLKEFTWLVVGVTLTVAAAAVLLGYFAGELAARLPFSLERDYAAAVTRHWEEQKRESHGEEARAALRAIGAKLTLAMALPPGMAVAVHYSDDRAVNAFATLGGNVVFYRGLIERLGSEDAVAMVLAHEIAHVKLRHPAASLGRGVAVGIALSAVSVGMGKSMGGDPIQTVGVLPLLKYSRDQERAADEEALGALAAAYGHVGGARELFGAFSKLTPERSTRLDVLQTHPLTTERVQRVEQLARERGWATEGAVTALPPALARLKRNTQ